MDASAQSVAVVCRPSPRRGKFAARITMKKAYKRTLTAVAAFCATGYLAHYLENSATLMLPPPAFKAVGPASKPTLPAKEEGVYVPNNVLHKAKRLFKGSVFGSESVAVDADGALYMLDKYARVLRARLYKGEPDGRIEKLAHLGAGRPLGYHFDAHGNLLICNSGTGLQMLEKDTNRVVLLASEAPSNDSSGGLTPIRYANDLAIAKDGSVYFTDSTEMPPALNAAGFYDTMQSYILAMLQGDRTGRLLKYDPSTQQTSFVAGGFFYSNGVALAKDESYLLVVETCTLTVHRIWLKGPQAGLQEPFYGPGPGYPDGVHRSDDGTIWVSIVTHSQPAMEKALGSRFMRWLLPRIPASLKKIRKGTSIVQLSERGEVLRYLADADGSHINTISALTETADGFYLGNLGGDCVSFLSKADLPPVATTTRA